MKKSHIAMLAAAGLVLFMLFLVMGFGRFVLGKAFDSRAAAPLELQISPGGKRL